MSTNAQQRVFPLHLTPFEAYMFHDDRPRFPMTFVVQFEFSGEINRTAFQSAINQGLERHPMLRALIRKAKLSRDCWVAATEYDAAIDWGDLDQTIVVDGNGKYLNLREEIGFRCWCRHDHEKAFVTFVFHHSTCDGIGAYQFLGDVLWFYAREMGADCSDLPEISARDLRQRMKANLGEQFMGEVESRKPLDHVTAQPLSTTGSTTGSTAASADAAYPFPNFQTHTFEKDQFRDLRLQSQERGQTVNDRLLETLLVAVGTWNQQHGSDLADRDFCINMPLDLRQQNQPVFSAVNLVTSALVRRSFEQISDRKELVRTLCEETRRVKHSRLQSDFMRRLVESPENRDEAHDDYQDEECFSTAVFSNTGDPTRRFLVSLPRENGLIRSGNLLLEDINGVPPMRTQTRATISIFTYRRRLRICLRCDPQYFTDADAEAFLKHFITCLEF